MKNTELKLNYANQYEERVGDSLTGDPDRTACHDSRPALYQATGQTITAPNFRAGRIGYYSMPLQYSRQPVVPAEQVAQVELAAKQGTCAVSLDEEE